MDLQWTFERRILDHELPYPPLRKAVKITLGSREAWAEELLEGARGGRIFTDGSKLEDGSVGAAFVRGIQWEREGSREGAVSATTQLHGVPGGGAGAEGVGALDQGAGEGRRVDSGIRLVGSSCLLEEWTGNETPGE